MPAPELVNVLVVDDHPANLIAMEALLEGLGVQCIKAQSGAEALNQVDAHDWAVILLDVQMPGMDGFQTAAALRQQQRTAKVPIIFVTGSEKGSAQVFKGYELGAVDYLIKPAIPEIVRAKVAVFVDLFRTAAQLRRTSDLQTVNLRSAPIALYVAQVMDLGTTWVSDNLQNLTGFTADRFTADPQFWAARLHPEDREQVSQEIQAASETGRFVAEYRWQVADGSYRWIIDNGVLIRDEKGNPKEVAGAWLDITAHKQAEEKLRASEARNHALLNAIPDLIFRIGRDGTYLDYAAADVNDLLVPPDQFLGKKIVDVLPRPLAHRCMTAIDNTFQTGKVEVYEYDLEMNGTVRSFEARSVACGSDEVVVIVRNITKRKVLERQLQQAQKMEAFGQLAGGVAHDFNNLLTVISGFSEMILSGMVPAGKQQDLIREIRKAGDRAASLTRQLLAFSRKQMLQPVELDLNALVAETEKMLRRLIGEDIDLATMLDPALGRVKADPGQIEQVIMNLAVNARDAMPTGGHLTIETRNVELDQDYAQKHPEVQPGEYVLLAVTDSGCGMDAATRDRIFEPFFTTKEVGKGTGLGLATVHGIVKQSGGSIEVYSEVGRGTTFKIYLPRLQAAVSSGKSSPGLSLMPGGTETILLAEDEEGVLATVRLALESNGYTVLAAPNGEEAVQLCQQHPGPIQLLMTDVVMPKMSGRQLADLVVGLRPNIKVLYLSGYTDDAVVRHGVLQAGMAFLQKPFAPMLLTRKVREVLDVDKPKTQQD